MALKHLVRDGWLSASYYTGLSQLYKALAGQRRGIISYHNVLPIRKLPPYDTYNVDVTAEVFEAQLLFLKKHFTVLPIHELQNPKAKGLFLTVDDGMANNYEILAPILEKHNLTALFAICPAMLDGDKPHIWRDHLFLLMSNFPNLPIGETLGIENSAINKLASEFNSTPDVEKLESLNTLTRQFKKYVYKNQIADIYGLIQDICHENGFPYASFSEDPLRYQFMTWAQVESLSKRGHQIASHTMTHRVLRFLSKEEKQIELQLSKHRLEKQLQVPIDTLVYPYGSMAEIDQATVNMAKEVGYKVALMNVRRHHLEQSEFTQTRFAFPNSTDNAHLYAIASGYKFLWSDFLKK